MYILGGGGRVGCTGYRFNHCNLIKRLTDLQTDIACFDVNVIKLTYSMSYRSVCGNMYNYMY